MKVFEYTHFHLALLCYQAVTHSETWGCDRLGSGTGSAAKHTCGTGPEGDKQTVGVGVPLEVGRRSVREKACAHLGEGALTPHRWLGPQKGHLARFASARA